jgi:molecular chaperone Hsp33
MVRSPPGLGLPHLPGETRTGRHSIGHLVLPGELSVIRRNARDEYGQSACPLVNGEIDDDVEAQVRQSEQIPTVLRADVLFAPDRSLAVAGGAFVQMLPDGDPDRFGQLERALAGDGFARLLAAHPGDARALLAAIEPEAELVEQPMELVWKCRCSYERAAASLKMFQASELAEMIDENRPVSVDCDLCGAKYPVPVEEITRAFFELVKAEG